MAITAPKPKGSAPGERRGGRLEKVPNKITLERAEQVINTARRQGHDLAVEVLDTFMQHFARAAYIVQPEPLPDGTETNEKANPAEFERLGGIACRLARDLAPYQSPTLRAIHVAAPPPPTNPEDSRKRFTLSIFEGGRNDPKSIAHVQPAPARGNGHADAEVVAIQAEIEDEQ